MKKIALCFLALALSACSTFVPPRYSISADTNVALKAVNGGRINVGEFTGPASFSDACRGAGPIAPPDNMTFAEYIGKALSDELKVAGKFDDKAPDVTLSGIVEVLAFSSSRGLTGGTWDIALTVNSSNGRSTYVLEHYEFHSGYLADTACLQTADAFFPAVQDLIGKLVKSPEFVDLVTL